ncbi:MAG TPA: hypothetical protein VFH45_04680, partial [Acidimicrobiales bacterium]|nr:hypothetical protein [Acidimicrobiales bacterium]
MAVTGLPPTVGAAAEHSARPGHVRTTLETLSATPGLADELEGEPELLYTVVKVTEASDSLSRVLVADPSTLDLLRRPAERPDPPGVPAPVDDWSELARWKRRELLRIAGRDLTGLDTLELTGAALADMADDVLRAALAGAGAAGDGLAVVAMGKAGARELNYASDVDILFAGEGDPRPVLAGARACFRVDVNLRPEGRSGPLTRTLDSYLAYWERWAQPWERQAMLKARVVAGPPDLAERFTEAAAAFVWEAPFDAEDLHQVRTMKARSEGAARRRTTAQRELKQGPGGIRDVEFAVQVLQLVHGRHDPTLRVPGTLPALRELAGGGYVDGIDAATLEDSYRFLRVLEHRLQLVDEEQTHTLPTDATMLNALGRVCGFRDDPAAGAGDRLVADLSRRRATARSIHERLYFRPLLDLLGSRGTPTMTPEAAADRLAAFGFTDAARTRAALVELTRGMTRTSRLMQGLLPLLLEWLSLSPDPDLGLLGLRRLLDGGRRTDLAAAFRETPETARRMCLLVGSTPLLHEALRQDPGLVAALGDDRLLEAPGRDRLVERARGAVALRTRPEDRQSALAQLKRTDEALTMAADILAVEDWPGVSARLTALAEAVLEAALDAVGCAVPLGVMGMGSFGGGSLVYGSDLDVVFFHEGTGAEAAAEAERAAEAVLRMVGGATPARRIFAIDARLRPEGAQGRLSRSITAHA